MAIYYPDKWIVVELSSVASDNHIENIYKILATWHGGIFESDSWKLSSGIVSISKTKSTYEMPQSSGSHYSCQIDSYGLSALTDGIYETFERQLRVSGTGKIKQLSKEKFIELCYNQSILNSNRKS